MRNATCLLIIILYSLSEGNPRIKTIPGKILTYYRNGNPQQVVLKKKWFPDGIFPIDSGTTIDFHENGALKKWLLLNNCIGPDSAELLKGTVVEMYDNRSYKQFTIASNWKRPAGFIIKAGCTIDHYDNNHPIKYQLAENWQSPLGSIIKAGTDIAHYKNSIPQYFTIATDWKDPHFGWKVMGNSVYEQYSNGYCKKFTLADDFKIDLNYNGKPLTVILAGKSTVHFSENGALQKFIPAHDFTCTNGMIVAANLPVYLHENGTFNEFTLRKEWRHPTMGKCYKEGCTIEQFPNGQIKSFILSKDWHAPDGCIMQAGVKIECYDNGYYKKIVLAQDNKISSGAVYKAGEPIEYYRNGQVQQFTYAENRTWPNGMVLKKDTEIEYYADGNSKRFTLAKDWMHPGGVLLRAGTEYTFSENKQLVNYPIPATNSRTPTSTKVSSTTIQQDGMYPFNNKFNAIDDNNTTSKVLPSNGIYMIITSDKMFANLIVNKNKDLCNYKDHSDYFYFISSSELNNFLQSKVASISEGEICAPFTYQNRYVVMQKIGL